jgi:LysR family transcriptional regulator, glycine cleavage system transcriptional activator
MPRRLPPLNALRVFEVAARSANFTRAAQELGVSQAAVSQQVKSLEANLGFKLFSRDGKRLVITSAGNQYLAVIRDALDRIAVGTDRLLQSKPSSILTVTTSPDFGAKWLVHRLGRFTAAYPEIDLRPPRMRGPLRIRATREQGGKMSAALMIPKAIAEA